MKAFALVLVASALVSVGAAGEPVPAPDNVPCRVVRKGNALFPMRLLQQGVTHGEAKIVLEVDAQGKVADHLVAGYTHPEFAKEALRAIEDWQFLPGRTRGEPAICIFTVDFEFTVNGVAVYEKFLNNVRLDEYAANQYAYFAHGPATLDRMPKALKNSGPIYPKEWIEQGRRGSVTIRFFIDETGQTRLPVIISGADDYLAAAAIAAVKDWRFEPPLAQGKPVLACAEQVFVFDPKAVATK